ncbi:RNA-processing protein REF2 [Saccharomyces eubayanus]|uniref:RNA-processing protein REF2 n=1 Tax=Saccharomyces eubayanus TaxID=1080349 RepID=UPI0006C50E97|nr:REF2-like protein [Saccharomyces eubayanus]KOH01036.1 REF2-like protein [Saccharomyces eubayanus]
MSAPVPQLVNISHALQASTIQQIRLDMVDFNKDCKLSSVQLARIDKYTDSLQAALNQFTRDNLHIERKDEDVTAADVQLYSGLKSMYLDYLNQLIKLKQDKQHHSAPPIANDVSLDFFVNQLPKFPIEERKNYIDNLILNKNCHNQLSKMDGLVDAVINLCVLDNSVSENVRSYMKLLDTLGFQKGPNSTNAKAKLKKKLTSSKAKVKDSEKEKEKEMDKDKDKDKDKLKAKVRTKLKPSPLFNNDGNTSYSSSLPSASGSSAKKLKSGLFNKSEAKSSTDAVTASSSKKKLSFSKYLNKDDTDTTKSGTKRSLELDFKVNPEVPTTSTNIASSPSSSSSLTTTGGYPVSSEEPLKKKIKQSVQDPNIRSILRNGKSKKTRVSSIKFLDDPRLIKVYGDDLPNHGLQVSPVQLKKILKPFKEGEPKEVILFEDMSIKLQPLELKFLKSTDNEDYMDISETKGGPIHCETRTPLIYRNNFNQFSSDLNKRPPREPIDFDLNGNTNSNPIIAKAFGKNSLLLRKDRGGLPYKHVPIVKRNKYPPRPVR